MVFWDVCWGPPALGTTIYRLQHVGGCALRFGGKRLGLRDLKGRGFKIGFT